MTGRDIVAWSPLAIACVAAMALLWYRGLPSRAALVGALLGSALFHLYWRLREKRGGPPVRGTEPEYRRGDRKD